MIDKKEYHEDLCRNLHMIYLKKDHDYGSAFEDSNNEWGEQAGLIRINDKLNRLKTLTKQKPMVNDESKMDTLMDLAGYCLLQALWLRELDGGVEETSTTEDVFEGIPMHEAAERVSQSFREMANKQDHR